MADQSRENWLPSLAAAMHFLYYCLILLLALNTSTSRDARVVGPVVCSTNFPTEQGVSRLAADATTEFSRPGPLYLACTEYAVLDSYLPFISMAFSPRISIIA